MGVLSVRSLSHQDAGGRGHQLAGTSPLPAHRGMLGRLDSSFDVVCAVDRSSICRSLTSGPRLRPLRFPRARVAVAAVPPPRGSPRGPGLRGRANAPVFWWPCRACAHGARGLASRAWAVPPRAALLPPPGCLGRPRRQPSVRHHHRRRRRHGAAAACTHAWPPRYALHWCAAAHGRSCARARAPRPASGQDLARAPRRPPPAAAGRSHNAIRYKTM